MVKISISMREQVAVLLGREPRGLREISVVNDKGAPKVIRVASLVDDKPFPTLFWLVDTGLNYRLDQLEAGGLIKRLQHDIDDSDDLQAAMRADHLTYIARRDSYIDVDERQRIVDLGFQSVLSERGIGGISDFSRIRCLHTWYAAHLVVPNTVGAMVDSYWRAQAAGA
ncbi:MAG: hypothetical protein ACJAYC_001240 [Halieaceae bacterium]